ncbi:MAG TPA: Uma2 family endonuclease [Gemmataceae bacterium]|nr:Uma2 family endonuclease [Gemmataceae bacterium]
MSAAVMLDPAPAGLPVTIHRPFYRLTVEQYLRMTEAGILGKYDRVELIEGLLVQKVTRHPPHDVSLSLINRRLARILPDEWALRVQMAIALRRSMPEPDLVIARGPEQRYALRHPGPRDIALLIEVADSSLLEDRTTKATLYADARISEYWVVNTVHHQIEVYTEPRGGQVPAYRQRRDYAPDEEIPITLKGQEIARLRVRELLPPLPAREPE